MTVKSRMVERELRHLSDLKEQVQKASDMVNKMAEDELEDPDDNSVLVLEAMRDYVQKFADLDAEICSFRKAAEIVGTKINEAAQEPFSEDGVKCLFEEAYKETGNNEVSESSRDRLSLITKEIDCMKSRGQNSASGSSRTELTVMQNLRNYTDPISKQKIKNPVRNTVCKHQFEKSVIENYLKCGKSKCPYTGCGNMLYVRDMVEDPELQLKLLHNGKE